MGKVIGIVGSRSRDTAMDMIKCEQTFSDVYEEGDVIVSGGCTQGGDNFAELIARKLGVTITIYHAKWRKHGRSAGPIRNTMIAERCDILIALVPKDQDDIHSGTMDTVRKAEAHEKKVIRI